MPRRRSSRRLLRRGAAGSLALALLLLPVLGRAQHATPGATPPACAPTRAPSSPAATGTPGTHQPPACATPAPAVTLALVDIAYQPAELTIPANQVVTIHLVGKGIAAHNLNIDELDVHTDALTYGRSLDLTITAAPGSYTFYCSFPGHRQAGMVGRLIVK